MIRNAIVIVITTREQRVRDEWPAQEIIRESARGVSERPAPPEKMASASKSAEP